MITKENIRRFEEIMEEIKNLNDEALDLIPRDSGNRSSAEVYWHPWINNVVDNRGCMTTMEDTLKGLKEEFEEEEWQRENGGENDGENGGEEKPYYQYRRNFGR